MVKDCGANEAIIKALTLYEIGNNKIDDSKWDRQRKNQVYPTSITNGIFYCSTLQHIMFIYTQQEMKNKMVRLCKLRHVTEKTMAAGGLVFGILRYRNYFERTVFISISGSK